MARTMRRHAEQDRFKYNEERAIDTVIQGHSRLWEVMKKGGLSETRFQRRGRDACCRTEADLQIWTVGPKPTPVACWKT